MIPRRRHRVSAPRLLSGLCLVLLLVLQGIEAGHVHADCLSASDCVICKLGGAEAVPANVARSPLAPAGPVQSAPEQRAAPLASVYRLPARGPPFISG